jgi:hypothetical protein
MRTLNHTPTFKCIYKLSLLVSCFQTSFCNNKPQPHLNDLKRIAEILSVDIRELLVSTNN